MNINEKLNSLKPYVVGIRFLKGMSLVDCEFKDGWAVKGNELIKFAQNESPNYYMFYSEDDNATIDNILDYVGMIIEFNEEQENKAYLFEEKCNELKILFDKNRLTDLRTLKFIMGENLGILPKIVTDDTIKEAEPLGVTEQISIATENEITDVVTTTPKPTCKCAPGESCSVCLGID